jgi:hypothetical protein
VPILRPAFLFVLPAYFRFPFSPPIVLFSRRYRGVYYALIQATIFNP